MRLPQEARAQLQEVAEALLQPGDIYLLPPGQGGPATNLSPPPLVLWRPIGQRRDGARFPLAQ